MIRLIYSVILLFILSGMYFVTRQTAEGLPIFLLRTVGISLIMAVLAVVISKKKELDFFGTASFFFILIVGLSQIMFGLLI